MGGKIDLGVSWRPLGASWRRLGGLLGHLRAILWGFQGVLEASGCGLEAPRGGPGGEGAKAGRGFQVP